jgi:hypothetical protein
MFDRNRRKKRAKIVVEPKTREELERLYGRVWSQQEIAAEYVITGIVGLTVIVRRKADDVVGSLDYQNAPRLYYNFQPAPVSG